MTRHNVINHLHMSHVTCHMSLVICHRSSVILSRVIGHLVILSLTLRVQYIYNQILGQGGCAQALMAPGAGRWYGYV